MTDQRSTLDQLNDLYKLAIEHGLHDAADWLKANARPRPKRVDRCTAFNHGLGLRCAKSIGHVEQGDPAHSCTEEWYGGA